MSNNEMKLPGRDEIEAYISEGGFICLKQENSLGEDSSVISMLPQDIPQIVKWLQQIRWDRHRTRKLKDYMDRHRTRKLKKSSAKLCAYSPNLISR